MTTESTWMETLVDQWDLYTYNDTYETEARTIGTRDPEIHQTHWSKTVVILDKFHPSARYLGRIGCFFGTGFFILYGVLSM